MDTNRITKKIINTISLCLYLIFVLQLQVSSQNNTFYTMQDNKFFYNCEESYPMFINYSVQAVQDNNGEFHISPALHLCYCNTGCDPWWSCGEDETDWKTEMIEHFKIMDSLHFNIIRLPGLGLHYVDSTNSLKTSNYYIQDNSNPDCYESMDGFEMMTDTYYTQYGDLLQEVVDIIATEDFNLKLLVLMGDKNVEMFPEEYKNYLGYMSNRFKNEPVIFGYDLYNEPSNRTIEQFGKFEIAKRCFGWYDTIKQNAPAHFVTIGLHTYDVFRWDPKILPADFISFHLYPKKYEWELDSIGNPYSLEPSIERYKVYLEWISRSFEKPIIIGETGLSAIDSAHLVASDPNPHPILETEVNQKSFAEFVLDYTKWYEHIGFSWWKYKDTRWFAPDNIKAIGNYLGLVYDEKFFTSGIETLKPVAEAFLAYEQNPCDSCSGPETSVYLNPNSNIHIPRFIDGGQITDGTNGIPDVLIRGWLYNTNNDENEMSYSISDSNGYYNIFTYLDTSNTTKIQQIQCTYPSGEVKITENWKNGLDSIPDIILQDLNPDSLPQIPEYTNWTIDNDTTWYNMQVPGPNDVVIEDGAKLTIKTSVYFNSGSRLIIERGGTLSVEANGKLTSNCSDDLWDGVEVRGNTDSIQASAEQGFVEIINGGTIENAEYGIYTGKINSSGAYVPGYTGGIIRCDSAFFINNNQAVYLLNYEDHTSASGFINTIFEINDDYIGATGPNYYLVEVYKMTGVNFTACTFINNSSTLSNLGGVDCYNSRVEFLGLCTSGVPCYQWKEGLFENLKTGIRAGYSTTSTKYLWVQHTKFINNFRGLNISGSDGCEVTSNTFVINEPFVTDGGCGLYLNNCTGYWVEDNLFSHEGDTAIGLGVVVHNSGSDANEIYRNTFDLLQQGISAQEQNKAGRLGLQILCNKFDECKADIFVPDSEAKVKGIAANQGANDTVADAMAGNLFYIEGIIPDDDYDDLKNQADHFYYYYPSNPDQDYEHVEPIDFTQNTIDKIGKDIEDLWVFDDGCPSQISSGGGGHKSTGAGYKELLAYYTGQVEDLEATLQELIDGGNTLALNTEVELSTPPETIEIYNQLMGESPFVSETVVETSIEKENVLPNAMVRDVMVANPHSATSKELMDKLDERTNPMPNYMKAQVLEARETQTLKIELESKLAGLMLKQARALKGIVREYMADTINPGAASDSLILLFQTVNDKNIKYRLAMLHLQRGEYNQGSSVMNAIPVEFDLNSEEMEAYYNMVDYYNLIKDVKQDGRTELDATETEIQQLMDLEQADAGIVSTYARNVLIALDEIDYLAPIQLPDVYKSTKEMEEYLEVLNTQPPSQISVFPNPSKDYVIVHYNLELNKDGMVEIKDANGKLRKQVSINRIQDQVTVTTSGWKPGLYIASLKIDGKLIESCKFTLIK